MSVDRYIDINITLIAKCHKVCPQQKTKQQVVKTFMEFPMQLMSYFKLLSIVLFAVVNIYALMIHSVMHSVQVKLWITFNEPRLVSWSGYGDGGMAPGMKVPEKAYFAAHNIILSHAKAYRSYKESQNGKYLRFYILE